MATEVSLVLEFGSDAASDAGAKMEICPESHDSASFPMGFTDPIFILLYIPEGYTLEWVKTSSGLIQQDIDVTQEREDQIELSLTGDARTVSLSYSHTVSPPPQLLWCGNDPNTSFSGGVISALDDHSLPAVGWAKYDVRFKKFRLSPPAMSPPEIDKPFLITVRALVT